MLESFKKAGKNRPDAKDAVGIFDILADMKDMAYGYRLDGCYARAHLLCHRLEKAGFSPVKVWAFEDDMGKPLRITFPDSEFTTIWWYHVAPAMTVRDVRGGKDCLMIFDPAIFDGPVRLEEWSMTLKAQPDKIFIAPHGTPPECLDNDYMPSTGPVKNALRDAREVLSDLRHDCVRGPRLVLQSQTRQHIARLTDAPLRARGETWISAKPKTATVQAKVKKHEP